MKSLFSLWIPVDQSIKGKLETIIKSLSKSYAGPLFEPHITLLGNIASNKREILRTSKQLSEKIKPFKISLSEISFSTTYYQSVFVRVKASASLMNANLLAKKLFQVENKVFMPHISLLYGNHNMKTREKAANIIHLPKISYIAESIIVTPSTLDPKDWIHLAEYSFSS